MTDEVKQADVTTQDDQGSTNWRRDLRQVQQVGFWVALLVSAPALGLPGLISELLHAKELLTLWSLVRATAPLTAAVAVIGVVVVRRWMSIYQLSVFAPAALLATTALGRAWGLRGIPAANNVPFWTTLNGSGLARMLKSYFDLYGPTAFGSALLVGAFLAWVWGVKLWPYLARGSRRT